MIEYALAAVAVALIIQTGLFYRWKKSNDNAIAQSAEVRDRINSLYVYMEELHKRVNQVEDK